VTEWQPLRVYQLRDVVHECSLGGVRVGERAESIEPRLGPPELAAARLGRKSKMHDVQYGNVSVMTKAGMVIAVNMDFEGARPEMVTPGETRDWTIAEWEDFARAEGWQIRKLADTILLERRGAAIGLDTDGGLHTVSLT
jgi:hypothetical protein